MKKGLFITLEGADGCGKTTQLNLLKEYLTSRGYEIVVTREPGGKGLGEKLREILLNYDGEVSDRCEAFLYLADRAQNIDTIIKPAINSGKIVLCDRHTDSSVAYQGYGREQNIDNINMLNELAVNGVHPDLTIVFDIDTETSMARVGAENPQRIKVVDASQTIEDVQRDVIKIIEEVL